MTHVRCTSRAVMVALLLPVWLCCAWVLKQDVFYPVWDANLSPDGNRLITVHTRRFPPPEDPIIRVWDIPSGKLRRELRCETTTVVFSPDGATVAMGNRNGTVSILDAKTFAETRIMALNKSPVYPLRFTKDGKTLVVFFEPSTIQLVHADSGSITDSRVFKGGYSFLGADSGNILTVSAGRNLTTWETAVFQTNTGRFVQLHSQQYSSTPKYETVSPSNRYVAVSLGDENSVVVRRLADGEKVTEISGIPAAILVFLDDSRLATIDSTTGKTGKVEIWQIPEGVKSHEWQVNRRVFSVLADATGRHFLLCRRPELTVYDLFTGEVVAVMGMRMRSYLLLFGMSTMVLIAWCTLWIRTGLQRVRRFPAVDLTLVHAVMLSLMLVRFQFADTREDPMRPVAGMLFAELIAIVSFTVLWLVGGASRWPLRVAGIVGCIGVVGGLIVSTWHGDSFIVWQVAVGCASFLGCLVPALACLKWCGLSLHATLAAATNHTSVTTLQWTLRDTLFFATAVGLFFAFGRFLKPSVLPTWLFLFLALDGATYALVVVVAAWAAMSRRSPFVRGAVFLILAGLIGFIPTIAFPKSPILPWDWYVVVHALVACIVVLTVRIYRGYSLDPSCARVS